MRPGAGPGRVLESPTRADTDLCRPVGIILCSAGENAGVSDESKPPTRLGPVPTAIISVVVAGLLGLAAGAKVDDLVRPGLGPTGAVVAGIGTALVAFVLVAVLSYRGLSR